MRGARIMAGAGALLASGVLLGGLAGAAAPTGSERFGAAMRRAMLARDAAVQRADAFDRAAADAAAPPARARLQQQALAARVDAAEAEIALGEARAGATRQALDVQRERIAAQQQPVAALLTTLASLARRPAVASLAQPGSLSDLVHAEAVLRDAAPAVRARTAGLRAELARTRALEASAVTAGAQLAAGRTRLLDARWTLAALRNRPVPDGDDTAQALALGEATRDIVDQLRGVGDAQAVLADLIALPTPGLAAVPADGTPPYRLPVRGQLVTGLGEVSDTGVRSRGLTFAVAPGAAVIAPAAGRVLFARPFRGFGRVVILDHGLGWVTLLAGLGTTTARKGTLVPAGAAVGRAGEGEAARITVELRRRGRPVDIARLVG